jgi:serine/threonine-protein kinase RsbW/stage II sporulation protein AB (anti-sigma F factor)
MLPVMRCCVLRQRCAPLAENIGAVRRDVRDCAAQFGAADPEGIALALSEALSNAIVHAYTDVPVQDIEVAVEVTAEMVVITVADSGRGMQPRSDSPGLGLGLPLIASLTQRFDVDQRPEGGTRLTLWFTRT